MLDCKTETLEQKTTHLLSKLRDYVPQRKVQLQLAERAQQEASVALNDSN